MCDQKCDTKLNYICFSYIGDVVTCVHVCLYRLVLFCASKSFVLKK